MIQVLRTAGLAGLLLASALPAQALTLEVSFDGTPDGTVAAPFVGSGTLSTSASSLADGSYDLASLPDVMLSFVFGPSSFDLADLVTQSPITVQIATSAGGRHFRFDSDEDGPYGGSADFENAVGDILSFQPDFGDLYFVTPVNGVQAYGTYGAAGATVVPLPPAAAALLLGLAGLGALRRRRAA